MSDKATGDMEQYTWEGDTWWMDGDCPECGHVKYNNGTIHVCGENDDQCDWWEVHTGTQQSEGSR